ncbi:MAG: Ribosomal RNA small subunit methyltransferase A, partial [Leptospirillum sp. Group IV 'UBA BS']
MKRLYQQSARIHFTLWSFIMEIGERLPPPAKHLGQHFLTDPAIARRIVDSLAPDLLAELPVLEIGPGRLILTRILAEKATRLILIEKDRRLLPSLREELSFLSTRLEIRPSDAMEDPFDLWDFPYLLISNLPYNISVPLLMKIIASPSPPRQAVLMFQKEVGERIVATPGGKAYGSLSVAVSL